MRLLAYLNIGLNLLFVTESLYIQRQSTQKAKSHTALTQLKQSSTNKNSLLTENTSSHHTDSVDLYPLVHIIHEHIKRSVQSEEIQSNTNQYYPYVKVLVRHGSTRTQLQVPLSPDMSVYDSIRQAKNRYSYLNPESFFNPFEVSIFVNRAKRCAEISRAAGEDGKWIVIVKNSDSEILHEGACIPKRSQMKMRPGYSVEIVQKDS